jgi:Carboxypeptidase regulatory-like domain
MTEHLHPGPHLDADHLAAFAEGALSERERQESLVHLSECAACRHIAFLVQEPVPVPVQQPALVSAPFWQSLRWFWQGAAAITCLLLIAASLWVWRARKGVSSPTVAHNSIPSAMTPPSPPPPPAPSHVAQPTVPDGKRPAPSRSRSRTPEAAENPTVSAAAPAAAAAPTIAQGSVQNLPLNGRSVTALRSLAGAATAPAADTRVLPPPDGALAVRIDHRQATPGSLAEVAGGVVDQTGASIPGATVTLRQGTGAIVRQAKTDQAGHFSIAEIPVGKYDLQIAAPGFVSVVRPVELQSNDLALLTSQLPIGAVSETVNVTSAAPMLQTESASVATVAVRLPHGKLAVASAYQEKRILAFDDAGALYLSTNNGKRWKTIKPKWTARIDTIRAAETGRGFELTTEDDAVWLSPDGSHWRRC